jgi:hypothetical protein
MREGVLCIMDRTYLQAVISVNQYTDLVQDQHNIALCILFLNVKMLY